MMVLGLIVEIFLIFKTERIDIMPYIKPTIVHNSEELDNAVSDCRTAILVVNTDIIPAIKEEVKKEDIFKKSQKRTNIELKGGFATIAAGAVTGIFAPEVLIIPAAIASVAGIAAVLHGSAKSISTSLDKTLHKMKHYAWVETNDSNTRLLLIKVSGRNKFDNKDDKICVD